MRKKINGKIYDTEKAQWLAEIEAEVSSVEDFGYYTEALYRTRQGRFFLYGYGGPMTTYACRHEDGAIGWGAAIVPLTAAAAAAWCDRHNIDPEEEGFAHFLPQ